MAVARVVILSSKSLFAEGVASLLREQLDQIELEVISPRESDVFDQINSTAPTALILDTTDLEVDQYCPLTTLLEKLPTVKIVRLDPRFEKIQVVTSEQKLAGEVSDLIDVILP